MLENNIICEKIAELKRDLKNWEERLKANLVTLKLKSGNELRVPKENVLELRKEDRPLHSKNDVQIAWVANSYNAGFVIHFAEGYNYHLGRDSYGNALIVTKK